MPRCLDKTTKTHAQLALLEQRYAFIANQLEHHLQELCLHWLDYTYPNAIYHASPNGSNVTITSRNRMWDMGACWGWPDLEVIINGKIIFVELKRKGQKPDTRQLVVHGALREMGFDVHVVDNYERFKEVINDAYGATE